IKCSFDSTETAAEFGCIGDGGFGLGVHNITVRNGTVTASESGAISAPRPPILSAVFFGASQLITVEYLQIEVNTDGAFSGHGYEIGANSIVRHNVLSGNRGGASSFCPSLIEGNVNSSISGNGTTGLGCLFVNNVGSF